MSRYLIIDGYNAIHKIRELDAKKDESLEMARLYFINMLLDFMSRKKRFDKICVVFDSKEQTLGIRSHEYGQIEALYTTHDRDADSVIVDLLRKASSKDKISVSSDDNFVRNHARVYGSDILSIKELEDIIMLKQKSARSKIREKEVEGAKEINEELKKHWGLK